MPAVPAAVELLAPPATGRVYRDVRNVRLGDVDRRGRLRLDATARFLQDIATDDASDAELDRRFGWLVRRTLIEVDRAAGLGEELEITTWCTGIGRSWAERRSSLIGERGARVDAVSLWVQIDVATGMPARVGDDFRRAYADAAGGRTVSSRLALSSTVGDGERAPWTVRRSDLDPFDHVNNAATWSFLEEVAAIDAVDDRRGRAEMEYLQPVTHGAGLTTITDRNGTSLDAWLVEHDRTLCAARWTAASS